MFVPTIKYKRVDQAQSSNTSTKEESPKATESSNDKADASWSVKSESKPIEQPAITSEAKQKQQEEPTIEVDPSDKDRILITLTTGQQYTADRYCPHAGADLSYLGQVAEDEYPPEIGPVLMCTLHYWEFALEKGGRSGGGWATLNACPVLDKKKDCPVANDKNLSW